MTKLLLAFPAFVIAVMGIALAMIWFVVGWERVLLTAVVIAIVGWLIDLLARKFVIANYPVLAVWMMEFWVLCPGAVAAVAAALLIILNVSLKPGEAAGMPAEQKELLSAVLTALTGLLTAAFIKSADDADSNWIAPHVRDSFYAKYKPIQLDVPAEWLTHYFKPNQSEIERWVYRESYGGAHNWNFRDRHRRSAAIARALRNGDVPDPTRS